ncbi:hypothetical protein [Larkinella knui]|uniref:DUF4386 family protein n=1 Tax=Larkinella knui TaxID=2025310 RepID=A0A3P1CXL2_9BACT|nr:hypothetical protein [Larkinella knui]RRB18081.1 hypothetical protein EHT87_07350 [Larkinella knui]
MRQSRWVILILLSSLLCLIAYGLSVIDWVQDMQTGVYSQNRLEGFLETSAQVSYLYFAIRFLRSHINIS